jgi:hypothetical protein
MAMHPAVAQYDPKDDDVGDETRDSRQLSAPYRELPALVAELMAHTTDTNDTDSDGLPDSIEWIIGTDPQNDDTDHDRINDSREIQLQLDPKSIDSNGDGIPDCFEVKGVPLDLDDDGADNAWDWDNDNDGVVDNIDLSPFAKTGTYDSFSLSINSSGKPTYVNLQIRTENPDNLRLIDQVWDWPYDNKGQMQDLDSSTEDVVVSPMLVFESNTAMGVEAVADYGMFVDGLTAYVPLVPVKDYGNTVAFNARMFIPDQNSSVQVTGNLSLQWLVTGYSDSEVHGLIAPSGDYVSVNLTGVVRANATKPTSSEGLDISTSASDNLLLKAGNGRYLRVGPGGVVDASALEIDSTCEFTKETVEGGIVLKSVYNKKYLSVGATDGTLYADVSVKADAAVFTQTAPRIQPYPSTLAIYPEDFMLTGMSVEENFGSDFGAIYGGSVDNLTAANLLLAYAFLRNGTTKVADMPALLAAKGIGVQNKTASFSHRDLAVVATTGKSLRAMIGTLPDNEILPIINIMEDRSKVIELSELGGASYVKGSSLSVNLGTQEVVVSKVQKTNWYNTKNDTWVEMDQVLQEMDKYGLEDESMLVLAVLSLAWNAGEHTVVRVGDQPVDFQIPDLANITDIALNMVSYGLMGFGVGPDAFEQTLKYKVHLHVVKGRQVIAVMKKQGVTADALKELGKQIDLVLTTEAKISTSLKWTKRVSNVLEWAGYLADIGIAIFTFVTMVKESGWNAAGVGSALVTSTMLLAYGLAVGWIAGMLAMCGPYGWIMAGAFLLLVAVLEFFSWLINEDSMSEYFVNKLVESLTDQVERSTVSCDVINEDLVINDRDNNGLDVGDRVQYNCDIETTVTAKRYSKPGIIRYKGPEIKDRDDSYLEVTSYVNENGVNFERGNSHDPPTYETKTFRGETISYKKHTTYHLTPYFEPQAPAVNYQFTVVFNFDYKVIYWSCFAFIIWWCSRESQSDSFDRTWNTFYFDVMPGTIDQFARWTAITSLDKDGDGLNNTEETASNDMLWDSDGDGLGDSYELVIGTNPRNADSDGDSLGDRLEVELGTNARLMDSDGDGIEDGMEYRGWVVSFNYSGKEFFWHIASDPRFNDTDSDGVTDFLEYWCLLNPMSYDTDGDGAWDRATDYWITEFAYDSTLEDANDDSTRKIEIDDDGYVYQFYREYISPGNYRQGFHVYNPNGTLNTSWSIPSNMRPNDFDVGSDGCIYVMYEGTSPYRFLIKRYAPNGTEEEVYDHWKGMLTAIAVDADNGHVFVCGMEACQTVFQYELAGNLVQEFRLGSPWALEYGGDGFLYAADGYGGQYTIAKVNTIDGTFRHFGSSGSADGQFRVTMDVAVDSDGFILVADKGNDRVQKFDHLGRYVGKINFTGIGDMTLFAPISVCVDGDDNIYVLEQPTDLIHKYDQSYKKIKVEQDQNFTDTDEDGLADVLEQAGWEITVTNLTGTWKYNVTSDPLLYDTDDDDLSDKAERDLGTDPNKTDTDGDGFSDFEEAGPPGVSLNCRSSDGRAYGGRAGLGTSPVDWDSDDDGLGDGVEVTFKSDPRNNDTDADGLLDNDEFGLGADPNSNDTDFDGLDDLAEREFGSGILTPDADGDMLFDGMELQLGTDPNSNDTDGDGLIEGYEVIYGADPGNGDTDDDGLPDGFEIANLLDATCNDTDGDNVSDAEELARDLNPRSKDSDGDGIPDELDLDYSLVLDDDVVLVMDTDVPAGDLAAVLSEEVNVVDATPAELLDEHKDAPYIVLVGDPAGNGTTGALIDELLADTGEVYDAILTGDERMAVRYGVWSPTQTVVMLTAVEEYDARRTLSLLKSMRMTVTGSAITAEYINPRACLIQDYMETVLTTDSSVYTKLEDMATFDVTITQHDEASTPVALEHGNGLEPGELAMDKYLDIQLSDNIWSEGVDLVEGGEVIIYYTVADLDRTGDGDADDPEDLDEDTLALYWYDEAAGSWSKLTDAMDWVNATELDTSDLSIYGREYAGSLWAEVYHLSLFGIGGRDKVVPLDVLAQAGEDVEVLVDEEVNFDGTPSSGNGILNLTWTFEHDGETVTLHGGVTSFTFTEPGVYTVTLTVLDSLGLTASDTMNVTVKVPPNWFLQVGPVRDASGVAMAGVNVNLTVGDTTYSNVTGADGVAKFEMAPSAVGMDVTVTLEMEGYVPVTHSTRIAADRSLEQAPPAMEEVSEPPEEEEEGIPTWVFGIVALLIILLVLVGAVARSRRPPTAIEDEEGEIEAEEEPEEDSTPDMDAEEAEDLSDDFDDEEPTDEDEEIEEEEDN